MNACFECDAPASHKHHVVPRVLGGTRTVWLCNGCHGRIHGLNFAHHGVLVRAGLAARAKEGRRLGQPPFGWSVDPDGYLVPREDEQAVLHTAQVLRAGGAIYDAIADQLNELGAERRHGSAWTGRAIRSALLADARAREQTCG